MAEHAHTITVTRAEIDLIRDALALKVGEIDQGLASIRRTERVTSAEARERFPGFRMDEARRLRCNQLIAHLKSLPL
jgi:hypothetical protein